MDDMNNSRQQQIQEIMERERVDARTAELMLEAESGGDVYDNGKPIERAGLTLDQLVGKRANEP